MAVGVTDLPEYHNSGYLLLHHDLRIARGEAITFILSSAHSSLSIKLSLASHLLVYPTNSLPPFDNQENVGGCFSYLVHFQENILRK